LFPSSARLAMSDLSLDSELDQQLRAAAPNRLVRHIADRLFRPIRHGRLTLITPQGTRLEHAGPEPGPHARLELARWRALRRLLTQGDVAFAEAYMDGDWSSPDLPALIEFAAVNGKTLDPGISGGALTRALNRLRHTLRANTRAGSRRNIMAHYDLGNEFYARWLDPSMTYSSALYDAGVHTLEDAQIAKQDRAIELMRLSGVERVLEIGCGWGALMGRTLARGAARMVGLTLSPAQREGALARLAAAGVADRAEVVLRDYRDETSAYDRIVSIEMIEAVGEAYWPAYFRALHDRLVSGGRAVVQAITLAEDRYAAYRVTPDFIQRYIFPGGMIPTRSEIDRQARAAGLRPIEDETFGLSYARTLAEWRRRFHEAWPAIAPLGFDERFRRMWDYYLAYCEGGFRAGSINVGLYVFQRP
jgi:cyclopropane-fatty-acyl-phospholipid synthase